MGKRKMKKIRKICEEDKWQWRKVGGSFPHFLNNSVNDNQRERKRREKRK